MNHTFRTLIAVILSTLVLASWQLYVSQNEKQNEEEYTENYTDKRDIKSEEVSKKNNENNKKAVKDIRIPFYNKFIKGSLNLRGAKIDDLVLLKYNETTRKNSQNVTLLSAFDKNNVYYAEFGWIGNADTEVPDNNSMWIANNTKLTSSEPIVLSWSNKEGMVFVIKITLDEKYMFTVEQKVINSRNRYLKPYSAISRNIQHENKKDMLIHEGAIGVFNNKLKEVPFEDIKTTEALKFSDSDNGWSGFSDKYWLTAIIPENSDFTSSFSHYRSGSDNRYQVDTILKQPFGNSKIHFFAGAKRLTLLDEYQKKYNTNLFDRAVDFGILYFITKPIFITINFFNSLAGNFGIAIIMLTVLIKLLLFPLAYKGFKGMNKLKELQPEMEKLRKSCAKDNLKLQKSLMELYKKHNVNPMSGCLPIILQMPIFFALYKVLYVTIEMRHANFYLWIKDLSASDPSNIFTLFGLIPIDMPEILHVGVLPLLMSITLFIQQKLNPQPSDPTQAKVMMILPLIFLFMFASFPSGLVLYWTWSNILSISQQLLIKKLTEKK